MATTRASDSSQGLEPAERQRDPREAGLDRLNALARSAVVDRVDDNRTDDAQLARLTRAVREGHAGPAPGPWRRLPLWAWATAAAMLIVVAFQIQRQRAGSATLSYVTELDRTSPSGDHPQGSAIAPAESRYRFSDGTTVAASDTEAIQIEDTLRTRPRVRVARRLARVRVIHHDDTRWTFAAGPYEVLVTGTTFDLGWDPGAESLLLAMHEGTVLLRGPHVPGGTLAVRAGQQVSVSATTGALTLTDTPDADRTGPTAATVPARPVSGLSETTPTPALEPPRPRSVPVPNSRSMPSWRELVARGAFDDVLALARQRMQHGCEARCSAEDLRALGDAARYKKDHTLATRALQALRRRFPDSSDGRVAAYLLGRTSEVAGRWSEADRWYNTYLTESPNGQFAVEAASGRARARVQRRPNDPRSGTTLTNP